MNTSIYNISLDLHEQISPKALYVKRGDTVRELRVTITEDGKPYEVTSDATATLCAILTTGSTADVEMTRDGNVLVAVIPASWTATDGEIRCEVQLTSGTDSLMTPGFSVYVGHETGSIPTESREMPVISSADNGSVPVAEDGVWIKGPNVIAMKNVTDRTQNEILARVFETSNMYDEDHNMIFVTSQDVPTEDTTSQFRRGTVYLYGYHGDLVFSTEGNQAAYFKELHVYDSDGDEMSGVELDSTPIQSATGYRFGRVATIPEGAVYLTFVYRTHTATKTLVSLPMVTQGDSLPSGDYERYSDHLAVTDAVAEGLNVRPAYVSPNGSDDNDGWTHETAVATFAKALRLSNHIFADRGVYRESVTIDGKTGVRISPYDNGETTVVDPRQMIEINGGDTYAKEDLTEDDGLYVVSVTDGVNFNAVFNLHSLDPVVDAVAKIYRANVFVNLAGPGKLKLKPVLTLEELSEDNTFTWDPETHDLTMNIATEDFDSVTVVAQTVRLNIANCTDVLISDLAVKYTYSTCVKVDDSMDVTFENCEASYSATAMGFQYNNANGKLDHCYAQGNGYDGFNFHDYGYTELFDCTAWYNFDDGCSHHQRCVGTIYGGEYTGNGKAGIAPAYGANVNIYNVLAKNNDHHGVGFLSTSGDRPMKGIISGCALVGNPNGLTVQGAWTVNAFGVKYADNTTDKSVTGTLYEY